MCMKEFMHGMYQEQVSAGVVQAKKCRSTLRLTCMRGTLYKTDTYCLKL